jgi:hypothetical protein
MLTMGEVTAGRAAVLRYLTNRTTEESFIRTVDDVVVCRPGWHLPPDRTRLRDGMAILPPQPPTDTAAALQELIRGGAVAAVLTGPSHHTDRHLMAEAARVGLPLLAPVHTMSPQEVETALLRRQLEARRTFHALQQRLIAVAIRLFQQGEGPGRLLEEAAQATGAPSVSSHRARRSGRSWPCSTAR